jgi:uncharacterized protein with PQ loop repeat
VSAFSHPRSRAGSLGYHPSRERAPSRYRTLSAAAANVANAAAVLASQRNEPSTSPHVSTRFSRRSLDGLLDADPHRSSRKDEDDVDEDALAMLGDSFHSDRSGRHKHVFWSKESQPLANDSRSRSRQASSSIPAALQITSTADDSDPLARGRPLQRANRPSLESGGEHNWLHSEEGSQPRRSPRASRRGAAMIFMGAWALFGIGTLGIRGYNVESAGVVLPGKVLSSSSSTPPSLSLPSPTHESPPLATVDLVVDTLYFEDMSEGGLPVDGPPLERVIGRISAWACTTLYLTSRLPQIWKNFVRKSVEGLSMYLFVFAFLGNSFYVLSILSSSNMRGPPAESSMYLTESMPYLLGSGGTLMFDVAIVCQSFIYRPHPRAHGSQSFSREVTAEEEESLMRSDGVEEPYTPRRRLPVTAEEVDVMD